MTLTQIPAARSPAAPLAPPPAECGAAALFLQQSSSGSSATCSTAKEERPRDLLQTFPRAAWFPKRGAHTPEPLLQQSKIVRGSRAER